MDTFVFGPADEPREQTEDFVAEAAPVVRAAVDDEHATEPSVS